MSRKYLGERWGNAMSMRHSAPGYAIGGLCIALVACFLPAGPASASPVEYSISIEWVDAKTVRDANPSGMDYEISIDTDTIEISDMFAWAVWGANNDSGDPVA